VGRNGQLARCLQDQAAKQGIDIASVGRPELDITSVVSVERVVALLKPIAIINAAAFTAVDRAEEEPKSAYAVNRDGAAHLAAAAARRDIPFIHISTDYVFDGRKSSPYQEHDVPAPINVYGRSKLQGEAAAREMHPGAIIIRSSWIYSPYGQNFLLTMLRLARTQPIVRVVDDQHGMPTCAVDLAAAVIHVAQQVCMMPHREWGGVYHLANRGDVTWHGFAAQIFSGLARRGLPIPRLQPIVTADYPTLAARPAYSCLESSKTEKVFGVRLPPWQDSLEVCLGQIPLIKDSVAC
jgi:dTDP-4-dehydrorhamnose reductase